MFSAADPRIASIFNIIVDRIAGLFGIQETRSQSVYQLSHEQLLTTKQGNPQL